MAKLPLAAITIFLLTLFQAPLSAADYHVDCSSGSDQNSGLSAEQAWRSVDKINNTTFAPGDSILLKRGSRCPGMLWPKGSGQEGRPIRVGAYGKGALPLVDGSGHEAALKLFNQEYWHIENLETKGGDPYGIFVSGDRGKLRHFRLTNLVVHDVTGQVKTKSSGLVVFNSGGSDQTFDNVLIDGVTAYNTTQWCGIMVRGAGGNDLSDWSRRASNVVIRNSIAHDVFGDGIVMFQVHKGLIEKSAAWRTGLQPTQTIGTPNGIWYWSCSDCVIEWTEGYFVDSPGVDGGVYDIDWGCDNSIVQYNFGHDSMGYCASVFGAGNYTTTNSIVRYNVCVNNGRSPKLARRQGDMYISTWEKGSLDGVEIYNNTHYWNPPVNAPALLIDQAEFVGSRPNFFRNNVIFSAVPAMAQSFSPLASDNNLFWYAGRRQPGWIIDKRQYEGLETYRAGTGQDRKSLFADPKLTATMSPRAGSPVIGAADVIPKRGEHDAFGRALPPKAALGALEPAAHRAPDLNIDLPEFKGKWVLLSFLQPNDPSRTQVVFLQAAREQYWDQGLEVLVHLSPQAPADLVYDWNLGEIRSVAGMRAGAKSFPTTIIVSPNGKTVAQWEGFAPPADLGLTLRRLVGPPAGSPTVALPPD
jgi:hypothetical protein